jgi:hypothetical protein
MAVSESYAKTLRVWIERYREALNEVRSREAARVRLIEDVTAILDHSTCSSEECVSLRESIRRALT